jgi:hypothetical protein
MGEEKIQLELQGMDYAHSGYLYTDLLKTVGNL